MRYLGLWPSYPLLGPNPDGQAHPSPIHFAETPVSEGDDDGGTLDLGGGGGAEVGGGGGEEGAEALDGEEGLDGLEGGGVGGGGFVADQCLTSGLRLGAADGGRGRASSAQDVRAKHKNKTKLG